MKYTSNIDDKTLSLCSVIEEVSKKINKLLCEDEDYKISEEVYGLDVQLKESVNLKGQGFVTVEISYKD